MKRRKPTLVHEGAIPPELLSRFHRAWSDPGRIAATFPELVDDSDLMWLRDLPASSGLMHLRVLDRWACANGFVKQGIADLHALTALGLNGGPDPTDESSEDRRARVSAFHDYIGNLP